VVTEVQWLRRAGAEPRFFVLGHRGMLGNVVRRFLEEHGFSCLTTDHRYDGSPESPLVAEVAESDADVVVNCAGVTTQRQISDERLMVANALLPQHLAAAIGPSRLLIHASTDCVFAGGAGRHRVDQPPDATDPYGLSKRLGELVLHAPERRVLVLRTSIVGPEERSARGLLAWFLSQSGPARGWTDHLWNGITTLAWAKLAAEFATGKRPMDAGLQQPTTAEAMSKYELLQLFADVYDHRIGIEAVATGNGIDRTLEPTIEMPPLAEQLRELRTWWDRGPA